jgi:hypothetical protein
MSTFLVGPASSDSSPDISDSSTETTDSSADLSDSSAGKVLASVHYLAAERPCRCRFVRDTQVHHDQLLRVTVDPDAFLELMELAVTWGELDYSEMPLIPPNRWLEFVDSHIWADGDKAERMVSLAIDVALGAARTTARLERAGS